MGFTSSEIALLEKFGAEASDLYKNLKNTINDSYQSSREFLDSALDFLTSDDVIVPIDFGGGTLLRRGDVGAIFYASRTVSEISFNISADSFGIGQNISSSVLIEYFDPYIGETVTRIEGISGQGDISFSVRTGIFPDQFGTIGWGEVNVSDNHDE